MKRGVISALMGLTISAHAAGEEICWVTYEDFETMVPHTDLMTCPEDEISTEDDGFCRLSVVGDTLTIYHFQAGPDDAFCLVRGRGYQLESFLKRYGSQYTMPD